MCLAVPGTIKQIKDGYALVDYGGVSRQASTRLFMEIGRASCRERV